MARPYPDRLLPFREIDPRCVPDVAAEMDHLMGKLELRGIKLHPPNQLVRVKAHLDVSAASALPSVAGRAPPPVFPSVAGQDLRGLATVYEKRVE